MASFAHVEHPRHRYFASAQGFEFSSFADELVARIRLTLRRWAAARQQRIQDRAFWELALTDHRLMSELVAIKAHTERG